MLARLVTFLSPTSRLSKSNIKKTHWNLVKFQERRIKIMKSVLCRNKSSSMELFFLSFSCRFSSLFGKSRNKHDDLILKHSIVNTNRNRKTIINAHCHFRLCWALGFNQNELNQLNEQIELCFKFQNNYVLWLKPVWAPIKEPPVWIAMIAVESELSRSRVGV